MPARQTAAQEKLKVRLYSSLTSGVSDSRAIGATTPLVTLVSREVEYKAEIDLFRGEGPGGLLEFGERLNKGEFHLGGVWGLEYGWLRERFPHLETLVVARQGALTEMATWPVQIMVHPDSSFTDIRSLKNSTLAVARGAPIMCQLFLDKYLQDNMFDPRRFFRTVREYATPREAIIAVRKREADCVVLDANNYVRHIASQPGVTLRILADSERFPPGTLIGRSDLVNGLRRGLWGNLQRALQTSHLTEEGKRCCIFWRVDGFVVPGERFDLVLNDCVLQYPFTALRP